MLMHKKVKYTFINVKKEIESVFCFLFFSTLQAYWIRGDRFESPASQDETQL